MNSRFIVFLFLFSLIIKQQKAQDQIDDIEIEKDETKLIELEEKNFYQILNNTELALVFYYAPWCSTCYNNLVTLEKAKKLIKMQKGQAQIFQMNAYNYSEFLDKNNQTIRGYPSYQLYRKGENMGEFKGREKQSTEICNYLMKEMKQQIRVVESEKEMDEIIEDYEMYYLYKGESEKDKEMIQQVMTELNDDVMVIMTKQKDYDLIQDNTMKAIYKQQHHQTTCEQHICFSTLQMLKSYILYTRFGCIENLDDKLLGYMLKNAKKGFILFYDSHDLLALQSLKETCETLRLHELIVGLSDEKNKFGNKLFHYFELQKRPQAVIVDMSKTNYMANMEKHILDQKISSDSLKSFAINFYNNRLNKVYKSDPIPSQPYINHIRQLVGHNFKDVVYQQNKLTLLLIYMKNNNICKLVQKEFEKLAIYLQSFSDDLIIAELDGTNNELEDLAHFQYPSVYFIKDKYFEIYNLDYDFNSILQYLAENVPNLQAWIEQKQQKELEMSQNNEIDKNDEKSEDQQQNEDSNLEDVNNKVDELKQEDL